MKWVYDERQKHTLTNAWDRLVCRPKAHELHIPGVDSSKAPDKNEFLRVAREFKSNREDIEVHFLVRGVQWGWRYDKGLSEINRGKTIELADVLGKEVWISSRTDSASWKRLPEDQQRKLKSKIKELGNQLLVGMSSKENTSLTSENRTVFRRIKPSEKHVREAIGFFKEGQVNVSDIFKKMEALAENRGYRFAEEWKVEVENILERMQAKRV